MSDRIRPDIPLDWSAQQAAAVLEFLQILQDQLWMLYAADIQRLKRQEQQTIAPPDDTSSPSF
ncbi:MAG: hypothetical protein OSA97_12165 [Nevskia sp.]|nr:hypothetical protein [Nevskia sp.]